MSEFSSWGGYPSVEQQGLFLANRHNALPKVDGSLLPYGLGRSYGDSCLNAQGKVVSSKALKNFIGFDRDSGVLRCEAGITLADIIDTCLPYGWFLPVTPGTKYVTVAGAIANDVHGKNHHTSASFGNHIKQFELLRSDGSRMICSPDENADWFIATVGGLGLTGFITWVELQLKAVVSRSFDTESVKYKTLDDFFTLSEDSEEGFEYTVAWIDCLASGDQLGKGHFIRGNHSTVRDLDANKALSKKGKLSVPVKPPISMVNPITLRAFNKLYYERQLEEKKIETVDYDPFFYPLDSILNWNRIYGKKGFLQYQCVIPGDNSRQAIKELLQRISQSGLGSFLVVLKMMGDIESKGLISFAQEGATLAIDFPFLGDKTLKFLSQLDEVVSQAGGKLYPAKDARMSAELFQQSYPKWKNLESKRDPKINSDFWRRVTGINGESK